MEFHFIHIIFTLFSINAHHLHSVTFPERFANFIFITRLFLFFFKQIDEIFFFIIFNLLLLCSTCVSRCPPRSFPNQGGVCWPCHESCETCAGAGQDSCLTCAPAHLHVTDLAVCLQVCPEGYYESE